MFQEPGVKKKKVKDVCFYFSTPFSSKEGPSPGLTGREQNSARFMKQKRRLGKEECSKKAGSQEAFSWMEACPVAGSSAGGSGTLE